MLTILTAGLPIVAKDLLTEAITLSFGEGVVEITELTKDNLRQMVRLSNKNVSIILVVLDGVSSDMCKDIENGLYSSDKYHTYTDEREFVMFLNQKYSVSLDLPVEDNQLVADSDDIQQTVSQEVIEQYESRIADYEMLMENLYSRIAELESDMEGIVPKEDVVSKEDYEVLKKENLSLKNSILDYEQSVSISKTSMEEAIKERDALRENIKLLESRRDSVLADYATLTAELTDLKVSYSKQSGVIRAKENEIDSLRLEVKSCTGLKTQLGVCEEEKKELERKVNSLRLESSNLRVDLQSKEREIGRLKEEVKQGGVTSEMVAQLKAELQSTINERDSLSKSKQSIDSEASSIQKDLEDSIQQIDVLTTRVRELEDRVEQDDENLTSLNRDKLELQSKLKVLEKSTSRDTDLESLMSELTDLRQKYDAITNGVFGRISSLSMPKGSTPVYLTRRGVSLNNVRFAFAGSTESRKGAYKCLLDEFKSLKGNDRILIVDVVSETSIDYVFEIKKAISGIEWFRKGGGVQPYLSNTCLRNVQVLSPGLGYINDSYFLSVNWEERLTELENSGYKVVLFCGDISNVIGRVMHESFAELGSSIIYVHGNAIGSRTIVSNLRGLTNYRSSIIAYFEFNVKMKKFYELVSKNNECRVLSMVK